MRRSISGSIPPTGINPSPVLPRWRHYATKGIGLKELRTTIDSGREHRRATARPKGGSNWGSVRTDRALGVEMQKRPKLPLVQRGYLKRITETNLGNSFDSK